MNNSDQIEFVDSSLSVDSGVSSVDVDFEGTYPLQIRGHSIFLVRNRDSLRFSCTLCGEKVETSYSLWRTSTAKSRRKAMKYSIGHFYECGCKPVDMGDVIQNVSQKHIGKVSTPDTMRIIKEEIKLEIVGNE